MLGEIWNILVSKKKRILKLVFCLRTAVQTHAVDIELIDTQNM